MKLSRIFQKLGFVNIELENKSQKLYYPDKNFKNKYFYIIKINQMINDYQVPFQLIELFKRYKQLNN